ncbi:hypothetical protein ACGYLV_14555 [Sulfitobacter sp. M21595]|uniref:hypothetical protein n=1 Tax=Sulfitobacter sp. M21595 TaxID=3368574 RepID=UPI003744D4A9
MSRRFAFWPRWFGKTAAVRAALDEARADARAAAGARPDPLDMIDAGRGADLWLCAAPAERPGVADISLRGGLDRAPERRPARDIVADLNLTRVTWASGETGLRLYISGRLVLHETTPAALAGLAEQWLTAARLRLAWAVPGAADPVTPGNGYVTRPADLYGLARAALDLATRGGLSALARDTGAPVTDAEVAALVAQAPPYRPKADPDEILRKLQGQME